MKDKKEYERQEVLRILRTVKGFRKHYMIFRCQFCRFEIFTTEY